MGIGVNVFARHETFHPRFGWLKKGFDRAVQDPAIFLREDAPIRLGVGKNMVRSIRYWEQAFKLLQAEGPTEFGQQLLGDRGWDPFLEDIASLWLLHWQLLKAPCYATAWSFTFNLFRPIEFADYGERLASSERKEWAKIQGRFEDLPFTESPEQMTRLLGQAITRTPGTDLAIEPQAAQWFEHLAQYLRLGELSAAALADAYPLHPLVLASVFPAVS